MSAHDSPAGRILICDTCTRPAGAADAQADAAGLRAALDRAGLTGRMAVETTSCLGGCEEPVCLGVQGPGRAAYVFSGLEIGALQADIAAFCELYLQAPDGWIEDARPAGELRFHLRARLPALVADGQ